MKLRRKASILWISNIWYNRFIMEVSTKRFWTSVALLFGTIVGAGLFAVPFVLGRAGFVVGLGYFIVLTIVSLLLHLYFGEVVLAIRERHRFPGFAKIILGPFGGRMAAAVGIFGGWLAILAYIVLGGTFLYVLVGPILGGSEFIYQIVFAALGAIIVWKGLGLVARSELWLSLLLALVLLVISGVAFGAFRPIHLTTFDPLYLLLPYGIIIFALSGPVVIPEMEDELGGDAKRFLRPAIISGTIAASVFTLLFGIAVLGATGSNTTPEAIIGLEARFGSWITVLGAFFGFLAIITSYLTLLMNQRETFEFDYRMPKSWAWLLALGVPALLFLLGARSFLQIIGLAGGFFGGLGALILVAMYLKLRWRELRFVGRATPVAVGCLMATGAVVELVVFLRGY